MEVLTQPVGIADGFAVLTAVHVAAVSGGAGGGDHPTPNTMLVIPKRHVVDYFALGQAELNCLHSLMNLLKTSALSDDTSILGFNISVNCAGITGPNEMHCHVDLVPKRNRKV